MLKLQVKNHVRLVTEQRLSLMSTKCSRGSWRTADETDEEEGGEQGGEAVTMTIGSF